MNKYHFFVVYICVSRDRLLKFTWRHILVLISFATLNKTQTTAFRRQNTQNVAWMKRQFSACQTHRSIHLLTFGEQPSSVVTLERRYGPRRLRDDNDDGDAPGAITLNVVWMEREFDAYKFSRCMCPYNRFSDRARLVENRHSSYPRAFDAPVKGVPVGISAPRMACKN